MATTEGIFIVGDSHGEEYRSGWPYHTPNITMNNQSTGGDGLVNDIEPGYSALAATVNTTDFPIAIIQGGVNDIKNDGYGSSDCQTAITSMVATANSLGFDTYVIGMAPWGGATGWDASKQTETDSFNTWLAANDTVLGYTFVDIYTTLEDPGTADNLLAAYDSGDGLHCSAAGYTVWANTVVAALPSFTEVSPMALNTYRWRGAIEPAETGASGNEFKRWLGAVEPAAAATAFPGTIAGDGGHIWPARSNDPRWAQIITDSGITPSGNFIDDVHQALEAMASDTGAMDDLWKKVKAIYSITDTSEPFTY